MCVPVPYRSMEETDRDVRPLRPTPGRLTLVFVVVIVVGFLVGAALDAPDTQGGPMVGRIAPEVTADLFETGTFLLSDHLANDRRPLVLNLWASWCLECRAEFPALSAFARNHPEIAVVGVAVNEPIEDSLAFWTEIEPDFVVGWDSTQRLRDSYPGVGLPVTFIIDSSGTVIHQIDGGAVTEDLLTSLFR